MIFTWMEKFMENLTATEYLTIRETFQFPVPGSSFCARGSGWVVFVGYGKGIIFLFFHAVVKFWVFHLHLSPFLSFAFALSLSVEKPQSFPSWTRKRRLMHKLHLKTSSRISEAFYLTKMHEKEV